MGKVCKHGQMDLRMKGNGHMIQLRVEEGMFFLMVMCILEILKKMKLQVMALSNQKMEKYTWVSGITICPTAKEYKNI